MVPEGSSSNLLAAGVGFEVYRVGFTPIFLELRLIPTYYL